MPQETFPAQLNHLNAMLDFIENSVTELGFREPDFHLRLACEEALMNIIKYAYPGKPGQTEIICDRTANQLFLVQITDWGPPFNPLEAPKPEIDVPLDDRRVGGLGIFLIRRNMEHIDYKRQKNANVLTLIKSLAKK